MAEKERRERERMCVTENVCERERGGGEKERRFIFDLSEKSSNIETEKHMIVSEIMRKI